MNADANIIAIVLLGAMTLGATAATALLPNPVHCGLFAAAAFAGFGAMFIALGAEFVGFIQILVYVGAVAILIMFVILLTRPGSESRQAGWKGMASWRTAGGLVVAMGVAAALGWCVMSSAPVSPAPDTPEHDVALIGSALVTDYAAPLLAVGVLLTAALVGGVLFAFDNDPE